MFYSGRSLDGLLSLFKTHVAAIHQLNQNEQLILQTFYMRLVEALLGITDLESSHSETESGGGPGRRAFESVTKLELNVFFQSWDEASMLLIQAGDVRSGEKKKTYQLTDDLCIFNMFVFTYSPMESSRYSFSRFLPTRSFYFPRRIDIGKVSSICYRMAQEEMVD